MFIKEDVFRYKGPPNVRVLEQTNDGCILYTCVSASFNEIMKYDLVNHINKVLYVHRKKDEQIINASINPSNTLLAFTTVRVAKHKIDTHDSEEDSVVSEKKPQKKTHIEYKQKEHRALWWVSDKHKLILEDNKLRVTTEYLSDKSGHLKNERNEGPKPFHKNTISGKFTSYLTAIEGDWLRKFDVESKLLQSVHFLTQNIIRNTATGLTENRLLFVRDRRSVGLYVILTVPDEHNHIVKLAQNPKSNILVNKVIWCQFDAKMQRIFYIICSRKKIRRENNCFEHKYITTFCCEQFTTNQLHEQLFIFRINMEIPSELLTTKNYEYVANGLNTPVSSSNFNINFIEDSDGRMFLCWQILSGDLWTKMNIACLTNDVVVYINPIDIAQNDVMIRASFCDLGASMLLVHLSGEFSTVICTKPLSSTEPILKYATNCKDISSIPVGFSSLPFQWKFSFHGGLSSKLFLDNASGNIYRLLITKNSIAAVFNSKACSVPDKIFLVRLGSALPNPDNKQKVFPILETLLMNLDNDNELLLFGDEIIENVLLYISTLETCKLFPNMTDLDMLLPTYLGTITVMNNYKHSLVNVNTKQLLTREDILSQMEQRIPIADDECEKNINRITNALISGSHDPYSIDMINEELAVLNGTNRDIKYKLQHQLSSIFDDVFSNSMSICSMKLSDRNKWLIVLTYQRIIDHLKQHNVPFHNAVSVAREYVVAQMRSVDHGFVLFEFVSKATKGCDLFLEINSNEKYLLHLLNQLSAACSLINFPVSEEPTIARTSLHFRNLITKYHISKKRKRDTKNEEGFLDEFIRDVESEFIVITAEFVEKIKSEIPDTPTFNNLKSCLLTKVGQQCLENAGQDVAEETESVETGFALLDHYNEVVGHQVAKETLKNTKRKYGLKALQRIVF